MIKNIVLENIGEVDYFESRFGNGLNIIKTEHSDTIAYALGFVTDNSPLCKSFPTLLRRNTRIACDIHIEDDYCFDTSKSENSRELFSLLHQSREEDNLSFYKNGKYRDHSCKLAEYKDFEYYYSKQKFSRETNGACTSRSFRAFLTEYIRNFKPQKLNPKKDFYINIDEKGSFFVEGNPDLSASEQNLFDFLCFLNMVEFWEGFEKTKNFKHIKKPIVITELFEMIDESIPKDFIIKRLKKLDRQIFMIERK